jgi:hypothetical protein
MPKQPATPDTGKKSNKGAKPDVVKIAGGDKKK